MRREWPAWLAVLALALAAVTTGQAHAQTTRQIARFGDWTLYEHQEATSRICFLSAQPRSSLPKGLERGPIQFFVSAWPKEGVKGEVSVALGYAARKGIPVTVTVGKDSFRLFAAADRAFVQDPTMELKLLEAVRKGASVVVEATSAAGTTTTDTYSLQGLTQGLQAMASSCS